MNLAGVLFSGMWANVTSASGKLLASGYTTFSYIGASGTTYVVCASNYGTTIFNRWGDGSVSACKTITPASSVVLTAYYGI